MVRRLRLIRGLILFIYVLTHLLHLVLALVSFPALEAGREVFVAVWRWLPLTLLLYASLLSHLALAFSAISRLYRLAMPARHSVEEGKTVPVSGEPGVHHNNT